MHVTAPVRALFFYGSATVLLAWIQVTLPDRTFGFEAKADLLLVLAILAGFLFGPVEGATVGLAGGFLRDVLAGGTIGAGMLLGLYAGLLAGILFRRIFRKSLLSALLQVVLIAAAARIAVEGFSLVFEPSAFPLRAWASVFFNGALGILLLLDAAVAIPLFFLLRYAGPRKRQKKDLAAEVARSAFL
jgi:rod shape-determining protein MreD